MAKKLNYFEFFGLPVSFFIDEVALKKAYLVNSKRFHPDFHSYAGEAEQEEMLEQSTLNNKGFGILSQKDARLRYILEIYALLGEAGSTPAVPQDFLIEIMDINETLMDLEFEFDEEKYRKLVQAVSDIDQQLDDTVALVLHKWTPENPESVEMLKKVRDYFLKKRYLLRIKENLSTFASA